MIVWFACYSHATGFSSLSTGFSACRRVLTTLTGLAVGSPSYPPCSQATTNTSVATKEKS